MKKTILFLILVASILISVNYNSTCKRYSDDLLKVISDNIKSYMYSINLKSMQNGQKFNVNLTKTQALQRATSIITGSITYSLR